MKITAISSLFVMICLTSAARSQNYQCPPAAELKEAAECVPNYGLLVYSSGKFVSHELKCAVPAGQQIAIVKQNAAENWYMIGFSDNTYGYIPRQHDDGDSTVSDSCSKKLTVGATN